MDHATELAGARRDNAGLIFVPVDIKPGCRGPACPIFDACRGRCTARPAPVNRGAPIAA